jgi:hypothetical protein
MLTGAGWSTLQPKVDHRRLEPLKGDALDSTVAQRAVRNARDAGTDAEFQIYPGQDHYSMLAPESDGGGVTDIIRWLDIHKRQGSSM